MNYAATTVVVVDV